MATIQCGTRAFENVRAIVFDKDGTLADSHPLLGRLAQQRASLVDAAVPGLEACLLKVFGMTPTGLNLAGLMAVGTRPENEIAAAACVAIQGYAWLEALTLVKAAFIQADQALQRKALHTPPFEGVRSLLQQLAEGGVAIAVLSGDTTANVQDFLTYYELTQWVSYAAGSDHFTKPDSRFLQQACEVLQIPPEETLVIGDASTDLEMARLAGAAASIGVTWGGATPAALTGATVAIAQPAEIQLIH
jgi:phosphoglycolate phosphatase